MKSVTIIYNGAADKPVGEISDRTPLEVIRAENASRIAASGQSGLLDLQDLPAGAGHQLLAELLGIPSDIAMTLNRGPLWAASLNEDVGDYDFAYCANFVTVDENGQLIGSRVEHLSLEETHLLAQSIEARLDGDVRVRAVAPAQAVFLCRSEEVDFNPGRAPALSLGTRVEKYISSFKKQSKMVGEWMRQSSSALENHSVNEVRVDLGENPSNLLWLWDGGLIQATTVSSDKTVVLTNSPMAAGLAALVNAPVLPLNDPWRMEAEGDVFHMPDVVHALRENDRLFIYVEAPGCLGTFGLLPDKLRMLEAADQRLLTPLNPILEANRPYRLAILSDSVVSTDEGIPVKGFVPLVITGEGISQDNFPRWSECDCANGTLGMVTRSMFRHMVGA